MTAEGDLGKAIGTKLVEGRGNIQFVEITYAGGNIKKIPVPRSLPKDLEEIDIRAVTVMRLAINEAFSDETSGVDQAGFLVQREENIRNLPHQAEVSYKEALDWAGAVIQQRGRLTAKEVVEILFDELPIRDLGPNTIRVYKSYLRSVIVSHFPSAGAAIERRKKRKVHNW